MSHWLPESFINGPIKHSLKLSIAVIQFSFKLFFSFGLTAPQLKTTFRESQQGDHLKSPKPRTLVYRCQLHGRAGGLLPSAPPSSRAPESLPSINEPPFLLLSISIHTPMCSRNKALLLIALSECIGNPVQE